MNFRSWLQAACLAGMGFLLAASSANAQPGRGGPGRGGPGGFFGGMGGIDLLRQDDVRKELEIVDEQESKLRELGEKMREEMQQVFQGFRDLGPEEREKKMEENRSKMEARMAEMKKKVDDILLPHQRDRLKQIQLQSRLRFQGAAATLNEKDFAETLGVSDEQKTKIQEKLKEVETEMEEKIAKVREEAREKILSVLEPAQREKFKKLIGEPFKFQQGRPSFQGRDPASKNERSTRAT